MGLDEPHGFVGRAFSQNRENRNHIEQEKKRRMHQPDKTDERCDSGCRDDKRFEF
jgi:hypothetical protein